MTRPTRRARPHDAPATGPGDAGRPARRRHASLPSGPGIRAASSISTPTTTRPRPARRPTRNRAGHPAQAARPARRRARHRPHPRARSNRRNSPQSRGPPINAERARDRRPGRAERRRPQPAPLLASPTLGTDRLRRPHGEPAQRHHPRPRPTPPAAWDSGDSRTPPARIARAIKPSSMVLASRTSPSADSSSPPPMAPPNGASSEVVQPDRRGLVVPMLVSRGGGPHRTGLLGWARSRGKARPQGGLPGIGGGVGGRSSRGRGHRRDPGLGPGSKVEQHGLGTRWLDRGCGRLVGGAGRPGFGGQFPPASYVGLTLRPFYR